MAAVSFCAGRHHCRRGRKRVLRSLQALLTEIYDIQIGYEVTDFVLTDRRQVPPAPQSSGSDEELLVAEDDNTLWVSLYLEPAVVDRLASSNPLEILDTDNISDYWTALEGISHFVYLIWNAVHDRP